MSAENKALIRRGFAIENWVQMDMLGLMQQLGVIPTPGQGGE
jgi:hypothetical protein